MAAMTRYEKSCGNGRTFIGAELHLCILSSPLPKNHEGSPQESRGGTWAPGITWKVSES